MSSYDFLIRRALIVDGTGNDPFVADLAVKDERIAAIGDLSEAEADSFIDGENKILCPGFIDVHSHDDISVIQKPDMIPKISQGVTTVVVGNCGISAAPVLLRGDPPDPMNLLGEKSAFKYPSFISYLEDLERVRPATNVAAFIGHTALRNNHMPTLDRAATEQELDAMARQINEPMQNGALGLSTGLAYASAINAPTSEVKCLLKEVVKYNGIYVTHMRSESNEILDAIQETLDIGRHSGVPVIISHLKCAGKSNWGRAEEILTLLQNGRMKQPVGWDCYPYTASSSTLDLKQVTDEYDITVTWSNAKKEIKNRLLLDIARQWNINVTEAAQKLQPAGAIYHNMSESDMHLILSHPGTMIGSDGLPNDPHPHPRLWGTFPRVLSRCCRDLDLFNLATAVHKMTGLPARRFGWNVRGLLRQGYAADLVLLDFTSIQDIADYVDPQCKAKGIETVWVNGTITYQNNSVCNNRNGKFISRGKIQHSIPY